MLSPRFLILEGSRALLFFVKKGQTNSKLMTFQGRKKAQVCFLTKSIRIGFPELQIGAMCSKSIGLYF